MPTGAAGLPTDLGEAVRAFGQRADLNTIITDEKLPGPASVLDCGRAMTQPPSTRNLGDGLMIKVYGRNNSINVQKVMWCLAEVGQPYERSDIGGAYGGNREGWFLALNPNGLVPVIEDGDVVLWESNAIVRYLSARYSPGRLSPGDTGARARADMWMDWQATTLQPATHPVFWGLVRTPEAERDQAAIARGVRRLGELFGLINRELDGKQYLLGEEPTMADIPLGAMCYRWHALPIERPHWPNVEAWYERLKERDGFCEHVMIPLT